MKKFLTVLLVIAVMFTFSFGSAFAGTTYTYDQAVTELQKVATNTINSTKDAMTVANASYSGVYSKDAVKVANQDIFDEDEAAVKKALDNQLTALYEASKKATTDAYDITAYVNEITSAATKAYIKADSGNEVVLSKAEITFAKEKLLTNLNAIDLSVYSKEIASGELKSNYDKASELVTKAIKAVEAQEASDDATANGEILKRFGWIYTPAVGTGNPSGALYTNTGVETVFGVSFVVENADGTFYYGLKDIPTTSKEVVDTNKLEYAKTKALSEILGVVTADKDQYVDDYTAQIFAENQKAKPDAKKIAELEEKLDAVKSAYADTVEVVTYLVNNAEKVSQLGSFDANNKWQGTNWLQANKYGTGAEFGKHAIDAAKNANYLKASFRVEDAVKRVALVKEAKENAELLKATIAIDGSTKVEIDKALEKAIDEIYKGTKTDASISGYNAYEYLFHYVEDELIGTAQSTVKINGVTYKSINAWSVDDYDDAKKPEVRAIKFAAKSAVRAAATVTEADEAFLAAKAELDGVVTAAQHNRDFNLTSGAYYKDYNAAKKEIAAAAAAKVAAIKKLGQTNDYATTKSGKDLTTLVKYYTDELYDECFNSEELAAKVAEAKADIDALKTDKVLGEEAAAIEKEVAALANTATLADKDTVMAVYDKVLAHNDYCDLVDSAKTVSYVKVEKLAGLVEDDELAAIKDAVKAIEKDGKVTLDESEAVEAARDAIDAYDDFWCDYIVYDANNYGVLEAKISGFEDEIYKLEIKEVLNMIAKLPADGSDAAAVKEARAAFDALSRFQQHDIRHGYATVYDKLVDAEKMMAAEVEALKITASSKATKGAITVKWTVKGNAAAADGYQVWKSTKKNSGFKKMFTTAKTSYKNTKGLKKGTRYYYKVRAYKVVDGKNIYSDWSNKAYRIAK